MNNVFRVGIAGFGIVGERRRFFIDQHPNLKTVAVCDRKFKDQGIMPDGVKYFSDYQHLLGEELDILFVCLTNDIAAEVTMAGLNKKLHVFCEKPPGRDVDDIRSVQKVEATNPKLKLMYGFNHRYHESIKEALKIVSSGELGKVLNLRGVYGKSQIVSFKSDWRTKRSVAGGGILLDQGIHMVDLMRLFAGEFAEIFSFIDNSFWNHDVEDNAYALMKSQSGIVAFLHSTATQWRHRFQLDINMEKGSIGLSGILSGSKSYGAETITVSLKAENESGDPKEITTRYNEDNSWKDEISTFVEYIIKDQSVTSGSSNEAYKTMELVYKIYCADEKWKNKYNLTV
jgi:predicted dehydrogenase